MEITTNANEPWKVSHTIDSKEGLNKTLNTAGKYVDRNINLDIDVQAGSLEAGNTSLSLTAGAGSVTLKAGTGDSKNTANASLSLLDTAPTNGDYYTLTATGAGTVSGSATGAVSVKSAGWVDAQTVNSTAASSSKTSNTATSNKYIKKAAASVSGSSTANPNAAATGFAPSSTPTAYYVTSSASGTYNAKGNITEGYNATAATPSASGNATAGANKVTYIPAGVGSANTASADVNLAKTANANDITSIMGTKVTAAPTEGYYVTLKASGSGSSKVATEGYMKAGSLPASSASATKYFPITGGAINNAATEGVTYPDNSANAPALISGDYLYINGGYIPTQKISLAKLVPDNSNVKGNLALVHKTVTAYDNDGKLLTGTMPDSVVTNNTSLPSGSASTGTINNGSYIKISKGYVSKDTYYKAQAVSETTPAKVTSASATISNAAFTYDETSKNYKITGSAGIAAPTVNTAGYISNTVGTKTGGTANLSARVAASGISGSLVSDGTAASGYSKYRVTASAGYNAAALTSDIPVYQGDFT